MNPIFSSSQLIFAAVALVVFIVLVLFMYRKDIDTHKLHFKGARWVMFSIIGFIALLFLVKILLKD